MTENKQLLKRYADLLETLSVDSVDEMLLMLSDDVEFQDPFNHTRDKQGYRTVMIDMFSGLQNIRFKVNRIDATPEGGYLIWEFSAFSRITKEIRAEGVSHLLVDSKGKIGHHRDYWDGSRVMDGIPLLGAIVKAVRKRAAAG